MTDLSTIRRAYRYVVAYERRILDMMARIDVAVLEAGFERRVPHRWYPLYRAFPSRDWPADSWAWDNVPLYVSRFQWISGAPNQPGTRYVIVDHIADTAFEERPKAPRAVEPDPLTGLEPAESSRTLLRWSVVSVEQAIDEQVWRLPWADCLTKILGAPVAQLFPTRPTPSVVRFEAQTLKLLSCAIDLSDIENASDVDDRFIAPLRTALVIDRKA
jgi:hypothetical protein